ncbi:MAG: KH domain-containing protein [Eubacterium sp.]|nr:KH domain-containing protein [Eubacterium sp.]MBR4241656.1 KH domain-containing protein [Eubacterium sp.]MBR7061379.1 KH domain-containing protein [Eubacterium sp.]
MEELLISITKGLVDNPNEVSIDIDEPDEEGVVVYHLHVAEGDMGRVIGKQGRIAKAIRVVMRAAATRNNAKISVEID